MNKYHFNIFKVSKNGQKVQHQFRGHLNYRSKAIKEFGLRFDDDLRYNLKGRSGDLFWVARDQRPLSDSRWNFHSKIFWADLCDIGGRAAPKPVLLDRLCFNQKNNLAFDHVVNPIRLNNIFSKSSLLYYTQFMTNEERDRSSQTNRLGLPLPVFSIKAVLRRPRLEPTHKDFKSSKGGVGGGGSGENHSKNRASEKKIHSLKILELSQPSIETRATFQDQFNLQKASFKSLHSFSGLPQFKVIFEPLRINCVRAGSNSSSLVYSIHQTKEFLAVSLVDLRKRRVLKSTIVTIYELAQEMWKNKEFKGQWSIIMNAFYEGKGDKLCLVLKNYTETYGLENLFRFGEERALEEDSPEESIDISLVEIDYCFSLKNRKIFCSEISQYDQFHVQESECRILLIRKIHSTFYFTIKDYQEGRQSTVEVKLDCSDDQSLFREIGSQIKLFTILEGGNILLVGDRNIYTIDSIEERVLARKHYSHIRFLEDYSNMKIKDDVLLVWDVNDLFFEIFRIFQDNGYKLKYESSFILWIFEDPEDIQFDSIDILTFKNRRRDRILITFKISKENNSSMLREKEDHLYLIEVDVSKGEVTIRKVFNLSAEGSLKNMEVLRINQNDQVEMITKNTTNFKIHYFNDDLDIESVAQSQVENSLHSRKSLWGRNRLIFDSFIEGVFWKRDTLFMIHRTTSDYKGQILRIQVLHSEASPQLKIAKTDGKKLDIKQRCLVNQEEYDSKYLLIEYHKDEEDYEINITYFLNVYNLDLELVRNLWLEPAWIKNGFYFENCICKTTAEKLILLSENSILLLIDFNQRKVRKISSTPTKNSWDFVRPLNTLIYFCNIGENLQRNWKANQFSIISID